MPDGPTRTWTIALCAAAVLWTSKISVEAYQQDQQAASNNWNRAASIATVLICTNTLVAVLRNRTTKAMYVASASALVPLSIITFDAAYLVSAMLLLGALIVESAGRGEGKITAAWAAIAVACAFTPLSLLGPYRLRFLSHRDPVSHLGNPYD